MSFVVKNTTKWSLLDLVCPHICRGCGRLGEVLCGRCKNNILQQQERICPLCKREIAGCQKNVLAWKCTDCELPMRAVLVGGWREGVLAKLIKDYKYRAVRAVSVPLVEILDQTIPRDLPDETIVVPLPTIGRHIRERGLDHTLILAKKLAKKRGWKTQRVLRRKKDAVQVGAKASERAKQAAEAYETSGEIDVEKAYLLLDDIWTTGATMIEAAKVLQAAGVREVYGAVLATGKDQEKST